MACPKSLQWMLSLFEEGGVLLKKYFIVLVLEIKCGVC